MDGRKSLALRRWTAAEDFRASAAANVVFSVWYIDYLFLVF